ncbi:MAG: asparagine--tRNA ligase ['Conium maculatum' witches'-broom phytoplasma]|nr:asparagine--tRNA ligase ['Conium maculatum' witches'-broom phytoplasma]
MCSVKDIYTDYALYLNKKIAINGWLKNGRFQKKFVFIDLNDGTYVDDLQIVLKESEGIDLNTFKDSLTIGTAVKVEGVLVATPQAKKPFELLASQVHILGNSSSDYPIQPKKHSKEFLRTVAHLRLRTNLFGVVFRLRNTVSMAIHHFFQQEGFINVHTPILTGSDGEGAGQLFQVTTLDLNKTPLNVNKQIDYKQDFFGQPAYLTVTGQLEAEAFATAFSKVYTFSPTFRAENSHTQRHMSEFWMVEPEMAFYDLGQNIKMAQKMLQSVISYSLEKSRKDFEFLDQKVENGLIQRLTAIANLEKFPQITYEEAINLLLKSEVNFEQKPFDGGDLATEHEKYLTDTVFKAPVFVINWPKEIKAFYMKNNPDNKTVAAMDLLVPKVGELIGGSQREENLEVLQAKIKAFNISQQDLEWYLDLRRFGTCVHSGFGLGFERLMLYLTGLDNVRDVIAFPRVPNNISF